MFQYCCSFKVLKILLVFCLVLVLLQYVINLVSYNYVSNFLGIEILFQHLAKNSSDATFKFESGNSTRQVQSNILSQFPVADNQQATSQTKSSVVSSTDLIIISPNISSSQNGSLQLCPLIPPNLVGALATFKDPSSFEEIFKLNPELMPGGRYRPKDCRARHRVAIIIPYRDRETQLKIFLKNIHPILKRQLIDYGIYVVDMVLPTQFNRAMLMNIGFRESLKIYDYQCFIFHDVDLIPENDRNLYTCPESPRHMSVAIDKFKYRLPYASIFGGVSALTKEQVIKTNGFSNKFFGWGGEDDDMYSRITNKGYKIIRYAIDIARYKMIKHMRENSNPVNPERYKLINSGKARQDKDGVNSLLYKLEKIDFNPTYTYILTTINKDEVMKS